MKVVLGNQLARLRDATDVTQDRAAEVLGCTQQKIAHIGGFSSWFVLVMVG
ncbi:helix-turn-helix domain-containing protein [Amycolatopsis albidoflavus]|uniref:Helix-turn-helix domain-containing protein n=1 Tax=Amycolatopsis albidoflavus TaxID=102226 RepID=A0ABW5IF37_9PSEU